MANEQNLVPNSQRSPKEVRENGRKGGIKSGETRREKKMLKDLLEEALLKNTETGNRYVNITAALIKEAEAGNVKAYETIRDTLGQKPKEIIDANVNTEIKVTLDDD